MYQKNYDLVYLSYLSLQRPPSCLTSPHLNSAHLTSTQLISPQLTSSSAHLNPPLPHLTPIPRPVLPACPLKPPDYTFRFTSLNLR
ncbi:hypothetical protein E2C01_100448 [Portunus trituberculatus]|uniref:Uncharacterized protein n=1 Tax=Portunus trituberculatus TaxID=210409 RepID=A0A5B7K829_PORTR|nr:hypothetical protein [Portunus trituberculatus]